MLTIYAKAGKGVHQSDGWYTRKKHSQAAINAENGFGRDLEGADD